MSVTVVGVEAELHAQGLGQFTGVQALDAITEPILQPLRQIVPRVGMIDITPMVAIIVLYVLIALVQASGLVMICR